METLARVDESRSDKEGSPVECEVAENTDTLWMSMSGVMVEEWP